MYKNLLKKKKIHPHLAVQDGWLGYYTHRGVHACHLSLMTNVANVKPPSHDLCSQCKAA